MRDLKKANFIIRTTLVRLRKKPNYVPDRSNYIDVSAPLKVSNKLFRQRESASYNIMINWHWLIGNFSMPAPFM